MKTSSFTNGQEDLLTKLKVHVGSVNQWFSKTPERSLEQAYQAALKIKSIEDEYFKGNKIATDSASYSDYLLSFVRIDFEKELSVAKFKLAEFKASRLVLGGALSAHSAKLRFVDEVLSKYIFQPNNSAALVPVSQFDKLDSSQINSQLYPATVGVVDVKTDSDQSSFLPKSIQKTLRRVKKELNPKSEAEVVKNFHSSRNKTSTAIKFVLMLILLPLLTQQLSKQFLVAPIVDHLRSEPQSQAFLNPEMKEEALKELQKFEEDIKFEKLLNKTPEVSPQIMEEKVKRKADELVKEYHVKSNSAISNVFSDLLAAGTFALIILTRKRDVIVLKSFMGDICEDLSDSAKAFIIILCTDMFVGFHSPHGWEVILEGLASHLGIPANRNLIYLFIATVPVVLDSVFKYWIFRYMSKLSPSAVATMRNMNE
ncbi:MAG TPA: proton extrusion protein PcxA [Cyanobacteria bacterium UBA8543]|nr:proton extrusion protein PcxA [Cyanobacteria bacterium UBA8543]